MLKQKQQKMSHTLLQLLTTNIFFIVKNLLSKWEPHPSKPKQTPPPSRIIDKNRETATWRLKKIKQHGTTPSCPRPEWLNKK